MARIVGEDLKKAVSEIIASKNDKKFVQTVELVVKLKNYSIRKDKRFSGSVKLPYQIKNNFKICVLGNHKDCETARSLGFDVRTVDELKSYNKNKKIVKKLAKSYEGFLASADLITKIPKLLGPGLSRAGKFPAVVKPGEDMEEKAKELRSTIKFQLKKEIVLATAIGHVNQNEDELIANITMAVNFLITLLKKHWQNVGFIIIKSTMGAPKRIYP
mmetsp:Transcript_12632/g.18939  ORF Transcript_12632/g.18939 Transcript_12632/m.18939 type:complete len:216 (+) Transcript_12632:91-738(+)